ncbi:CCDC47 family protein [Sporobolomyces koalae]|uniref:CCDC47 family protein n=1 Tax=Sporobolomyces koalae TaxID=500713 RepID=UPI0031790F16
MLLRGVGIGATALLLPSTVYAEPGVPPTTVDVADPSPGDLPQPAPDLSEADAHDFLSAAPVLSPGSKAAYTGHEYMLGPLRLRPAELQLERLALFGFVFYFISTYLIRSRNRAQAQRWFTANERSLRAEFAGVGFGEHELFKPDGGDEFVSYVSGRRAIESGWIKYTAQGYDLLTSLYHIARPILDPTWVSNGNKIVIDLKLAAPVGTRATNKMCFAVTKRSCLKPLRDSRWDLRTLTSLSDNLPISPELVTMTESGELTSALLFDHVTGLKHALQLGAEGSDSFESLVLSDMPAAEPASSNPKLPTDDLHLILTLRVPTLDAAGSSSHWFELACNIADVIYRKDKLLSEAAISKAVCVVPCEIRMMGDSEY